MANLPSVLPVFLVDSFATKPGTGNPAAVCLVPFRAEVEGGESDRYDREGDVFQLIAKEMNQSETVFVTPTRSEVSTTEPEFAIRWFSPTKEVILCGHATLAASHVLFSLKPDDGQNAATLSEFFVGDAKRISFQNPLSGPLAVNKLPGDERAATDGEGAKPSKSSAQYQLDFPRRKPSPIVLTEDLMDVLYRGLGLLRDVAASGDSAEEDSSAVKPIIEEILLHKESRKYLVVLTAEAAGQEGLTGVGRLRTIVPNIHMLMEQFKPEVTPLSVTVTTRVILQAPSTAEDAHHQLLPTLENYDVASRHFAPWVGIPEDPVTGAAHVVLAPYWADRVGKNVLHCFQASPRGGSMVADISTSVVPADRIFLSGPATTVMRGVVDVSVAFQ